MEKKIASIILVTVILSMLAVTLVSARGALTLTWAIVCEDATVSPTIYQGKAMDLFHGFGACKVLFRPGNGKPASLPGGNPGGDPGGQPGVEVTPSPDPDLWLMPPGITPEPWMPPCVGC